MAIKLKKLTLSTTSSKLGDATAVLRAAHDSSTSFERAFNESRANRKAKGTTTDEEQDFLRAMLFFAGAGVEAAVEQLVEDALAETARRDLGAADQLRSFLEVRLRPKGTDGLASFDVKFLSRVLTSRSPRVAVDKEHERALTSDSIQSKEQILRVAAAFGIRSADLCGDLEALDVKSQEVVH